jgi:hypothetical protein
MTPDSITPDTRLTRRQLAEKLSACGFPISPETLATWASRPPKGGGPKFERFGLRPLYKWGDALAWAKSRLSRPVSSTAEFDVDAA